MRKGALLILVTVALAVSFGFAATASADTPAGPSDSGVIGQLNASDGKVLPDQGADLQPFFPDPSSPGAASMYRANLMPVSTASTPEILDFSCSLPATIADKSLVGTPLNDNERKLLADAISSARNSFADGGVAKMQASLKDSFTSMTMNEGPDGRAVGMLIYPLETATNPYALQDNIPVGCGLGEFSNFPTAGSALHQLTKVLTNPGGWLVNNLLLGTIGDIDQAAFNYIEPIAFAQLFWTPHSERGDTLFNIPSNCSGTSDTCTNGTALGFSTNNAKQDAAPPVWIRISMFLQWLISLTYFIIMAGAAVLYMFRGHHAATAQKVMALFPRLIISIFLIVFSSWIIGTMITLSNLLVGALFSGDASQIRGVRDVFFSFGSAGGLPFTSTFLYVFEDVTLAIVNVFFFLFYLASLFRQFALLVLIVLVPVGVSAMLFDRTRELFSRYCTILTTLIFTPVALALVLQIGLAFNPAVSAAEAGQTGIGTGMIGIFMLFITFWVMLRVLKMSKAIITGKPSTGMMTKLSKATSAAGKLYSTVDPVTGAAIGAAGKGMQAGGEKADKAFGSLIPAGRMRALSTRRMPKALTVGQQVDAALNGKSGDGPLSGSGKRSGGIRSASDDAPLTDMVLSRALTARGATASQSAHRGIAFAALSGNPRVAAQMHTLVKAAVHERQGGEIEMSAKEFARAVERRNAAERSAYARIAGILALAAKKGWSENETKLNLLPSHRANLTYDKSGAGSFDAGAFQARYTKRHGDLEQRDGRYYRTFDVPADGRSAAKGFDPTNGERTSRHGSTKKQQDVAVARDRYDDMPAAAPAPASTPEPDPTTSWHPAAGGYVFDDKRAATG